MKLSNLFKIIETKIKIGSIVQEKNGLFTKIMDIKNNQIGGWWVLGVDNVITIPKNEIGVYENIEDVKLVK